MAYTTLLSIVGRINPRAWDAIIPHGPRTAGIASRYDAVALNPQPLPPRELFVIGAAELAHEIVRIAVEMENRGESSFGFVSDTIDDWCGTPWPRKWPVPWPGPGPRDIDAIDPADVALGRIAGAVVLASVGSRILDEKFANVFIDSAERLTEAALNSQVGGDRLTGGQVGSRTSAGKVATDVKRPRARR